jgi:hypothetical protein
MRRWHAVIVVLCLLLPARAHAQQTALCNGFAEGWKTLKGELTIVPICPIEPITPIGSTPYREGLKAGMVAAKRTGGGNTGGATSRGGRDDFCNGFEMGWKTVKGDLSIVPICPIEPITPLGSTPYREGIKAGIAKARDS